MSSATFVGIVAAVLCVGAVGAGEGRLQPVAVTDLAWLEGTWVAELDGVRIEERWTSPAGGAMLGTSRTLRDGRMVAFEFLRIVTRPEGLYYLAQPGGRPPTEFRRTDGGPGRVVFENPQHDHPRVIRYTRSGPTLTAQVEGVENGNPTREVYVFTIAARPQ